MPPLIDRLDTSSGRGWLPSQVCDGPSRTVTLEVAIFQEPSRWIQGQAWVAPDAAEVANRIGDWLRYALQEDWFVAWVSNRSPEDEDDDWEVLYQEGAGEPSVFYEADSKIDALSYIEKHKGALMGRLSARPAGSGSDLTSTP